MPVRYFSEDVTFKIRQPRLLTDWLSQIAKQEGAVTIDLNYIFCSDAYLLKINQEYLNHNTYTDIITFSLSPDRIEGEIYISTERVRENAASLDKSFDDELRRVIVHGLLHLLGYEDKTKAQKAAMRKKEDACLFLYSKVSRGTRGPKTTKKN